MEAVIATGGKQYRVAPGQVIRVERLGKDKGAAVEFTEVLLVNQDGQVTVDSKALASAKVTGEVVAERRGRQGPGREVQAAEELPASPRASADHDRGAHHQDRGLGHGAQEGCRQLEERSRFQSPDAGGEALRRAVRHRRQHPRPAARDPVQAGHQRGPRRGPHAVRQGRRLRDASSARATTSTSASPSSRPPEPIRPRRTAGTPCSSTRSMSSSRAAMVARAASASGVRSTSPAAAPTAATAGTAGSVILEADPAITTLLDFHYQRHYTAERGQHGKGSNKQGTSGADTDAPRAARHHGLRARRPRPAGRPHRRPASGCRWRGAPAAGAATRASPPPPIGRRGAPIWAGPARSTGSTSS